MSNRKNNDIVDERPKLDSNSEDGDSEEEALPVSFGQTASPVSCDSGDDFQEMGSSLNVTFSADNRSPWSDDKPDQDSSCSNIFDGSDAPQEDGAGTTGRMQFFAGASFTADLPIDSNNILLKRKKAEQGVGKDHPVLPACNCTRLRCSENISEKDRQKINTNYWGLKSLTKRRQWMLDHMQRQLIDISQKKWLGKKSETRTFYFPDASGNLFRVCKDMFLRTLGFQCDSTLKALSNSTPLSSNVASADQRGRPYKAHSFASGFKDVVKQHIQSKVENSAFKMQFNVMRSKTNGCGFVQMCFEDFLKSHSDQKVSYQAYQDIFVEHSKNMAKAGTLKTPPSDLSLLKEAYFEYQTQMYMAGFNAMPGTSSSSFVTLGLDEKDSEQAESKEKLGADVGQNNVMFQVDNSNSRRSDTDKITQENDLVKNLQDGPSVVKDKKTHDNILTEENVNLASQDSGTKIYMRKQQIKRLKVEHPVRPGCQCIRSCQSNIDEERRKDVHGMFWELADYTKQEEWIMKQRVLVRQTTISRIPQYSKEFQCYFLPNNDGKQIRVCRHHFMSTLGFSAEGASTVTSSKKGSVAPWRQGEENRTSCIEQHIQGYIHSGKSIVGLKREDCTVSDEQKVSIKEMHKDFLRMYPFMTASYGTYYKIYREQVSAFKAKLYSSGVKDSFKNDSFPYDDLSSSMDTGETDSIRQFEMDFTTM